MRVCACVRVCVMIYISSASGRYKFVVAFENSRCGRDSLTRRRAGARLALEP